MSLYKYGRNPGHIPVGLKELPAYTAGSLPAAPPKVSAPRIPHNPDGTPWGMDGNDQYSDCGAAGINHGFRAAAAVKGELETFPGARGVVSYYLQYTGGQDTGVVLADFLAYVKTNPFYRHTILGYAPVGVQDIPTMHYATYTYAFTYCGIRVTDAMESAFQNGQPWTLADGNSPDVGRHCVPVVGYDSEYLYCITWGKMQGISYSLWHYIADEAWAVIPGEFTGGDGRGVDLTKLLADLSELDS